MYIIGYTFVPLQTNTQAAWSTYIYIYVFTIYIYICVCVSVTQIQDMKVCYICSILVYQMSIGLKQYWHLQTLRSKTVLVCIFKHGFSTNCPL